MTQPGPPTTSSMEREAAQAALRAELQRVILSGESVALVGAGSSISVGYPSGEQLVDRLSEVVRRGNASFALPAGPPFSARMQMIKDALGAEYPRHRNHALIQGVPSADSVDGPRPMPEAAQFHRDLVRLPFRAIVTTNYDTVIEDAIERIRLSNGSMDGRPNAAYAYHGNAFRLAQAIRSITTGGPLKSVIHLHGVLDNPASIVCASSEYVEAYGFDVLAGEAEHGPRPLNLVGIVLSALVLMRRLVFIGFSLDDEYINDGIRAVIKATWSGEHPVHFALMPMDPAGPDVSYAKADRLSTEFGIAVIFYSAPLGNHAERDSIIRELAEAATDSGGGARSVAQTDLRPRPAAVTDELGEPRWVDENNQRALSVDEPGED